ncbi:MAG: SGNH/GDSL hydrolase family protein [Smithella sp.]|nr:SGNH/GDSL hydrolase family protein [Smithella sp.]
MKLLIRGGSLAAGYGVRQGYVQILTNDLFPHGIEVVNRSRHRETSFDGINSFNEDIAPVKPNILLVHFGVDDAFQCVYRSEFQENIVQIVRKARCEFNSMVFLATSHCFENQHEMEAVDIFYRSLRIVSNDLACQLIPVHSYWADYLEEQNMRNSDLVFADSRYPNEKGHQVIAAAVMKYFENMLHI